ncbi:MAG TPA: hypothetical protein VHL80_04515 [Polyangia bacterium]|nr:hypothetical protein [Polyangia bacterium]
MRARARGTVIGAWMLCVCSCGGGGAGGSAGASGGNAGTRGDAGASGGKAGASGDAGASGGGAGASGGAASVPMFQGAGPAAGNPNGHCAVPADAQQEDSSHPTTVVGTGTADSCTGQAFVDAVAKGGVITFDCGADPATIKLTATAKIVNDTGPKIVIDGGGKITLDGGGKVRILYQDTCDQAQKFTTSHCQDQDTPQLTVQNLTFANGNSTGMDFDGGAGGAIFVRGGRLKVLNSRFFDNVCEVSGADIAGGAIRTLSQSMNQPVYIVGSTFGGADGLGNACASGGALGSIGVSYTVINSLFSYNKATGKDSGGGNGGGIANDGNTYTLTLCGVDMSHNSAQGGGAISYVSDDLSGSLIIRDSTLESNPSSGYETNGYPGVFVKTNKTPDTTGSTLTK